MRAALQARGYSAGEAQGMVGLCGSRLRLLERALLQGAAGCSHADLLRSARAHGAAAFASAFARLGRDDAAALGGVLDAIEACEAAAEGSAAAAGAPALATRRPTRKHLPSSLQGSGMAPILLVSLTRFFFSPCCTGACGPRCGASTCRE